MKKLFILNAATLILSFVLFILAEHSPILMTFSFVIFVVAVFAFIWIMDEMEGSVNNGDTNKRS